MALSANTARERRNTRNESLYSGLIKTGAKIYQGALLMMNATGTVLPCADSTTGKFFGMALEECLTGNGTRRVECCDTVEIRVTLKTSVTAGLAQTIAYAFDDNVVTNLATVGPQIGTITERTAANDGWVMLRRAVMAKGT